MSVIGGGSDCLKENLILQGATLTSVSGTVYCNFVYSGAFWDSLALEVVSSSLVGVVWAVM